MLEKIINNNQMISNIEKLSTIIYTPKVESNIELIKPQKSIAS